MSTLKVKLFGKPLVQYGDQNLLSLPAKVQELFFFLLLHRHHPHDRDILAEQLWGNATPAHSKKYLRQTLWQLQTALEACVHHPPTSLLMLDKNWVHINVKINIWLDVQQFDRVFATVCDIPGRNLDASQVHMTQEAIHLYEGELLTGWYQSWCVIERERFQSMSLAMLEKLIDYCATHHQYENGVEYAMQVLRHDRARERTHRQLMRLYYLSGNRTAALRQFEQCVIALAEELNVKPAKHTLMLWEQIRNDQLTDQPQTNLPDMIEAKTDGALMTQVIGELKQIRLHLAALQQDVKSVMQYLNMQD